MLHLREIANVILFIFEILAQILLQELFTAREEQVHLCRPFDLDALLFSSLITVSLILVEGGDHDVAGIMVLHIVDEFQIIHSVVSEIILNEFSHLFFWDLNFANFFLVFLVDVIGKLVFDGVFDRLQSLLVT